jgi:two-component system sensor histidine kinase and response regulator WspE
MADLSSFSLVDLFRMEVETHCASITEGLLLLERNASDRGATESMMRAAHSVKGAARVVQLDPVVRLAHKMEDCFVAAGEGKVRLSGGGTDVMLAAVDLLGRVSRLTEPEMAPGLAALAGEFDALVARLAAILEGEAAPAPSGQTTPAAPATGGEPPAAPAPRTLTMEPAPSPPAPPPPHTTDAPTPAGPARPRTRSPTAPPSGDDGTRTVVGAGTATKAGREVRIASEKFNRLLGLASETLVDALWLEDFGESLRRFRKLHGQVSEAVAALEGALKDERLSDVARQRLADTKDRLKDATPLLAERVAELETYARHSADLAGRMYREVLGTRMRPFSDGAKGFPRLCRDLARTLGKEVQLHVVGASTEVDRDILDRLDAPLTHLIRNALDHGLEPPEERVAHGKERTGHVTLEAQHRAGMLLITLSDDGRGVDEAKLRARVVEKGLAAPDMVARMGESELLDFLFLPGFSTTSEVTEISGRGVGLDIVQTLAHEVGGTLRVSSRVGQGMTFFLQLPITRSVMRTLLVEVSGEPFAVPLSRIDRVLLVDEGSLEVVENRQFFRFGDANIGLVGAQQVLGLPARPPPSKEVPVVVLSDQLSRVGLAVDRFLGEQDLVVRPLDPGLGKVPNVSAAAIIQDGSPILILDVEDMVRSVDALLSGRRLRKLDREDRGETARATKHVLVVDDSLTVREVQRKLLENRGYRVSVAVDGMDGWNAVRTGNYDLVITDVDMPRMTGIELVTLIRKDARLQALPIMVVSYKDREEDRLKGLHAGANYYLAKSSFQDEKMLGAVTDLIGPAT